MIPPVTLCCKRLTNVMTLLAEGFQRGTGNRTKLGASIEGDADTYYGGDGGGEMAMRHGWSVYVVCFNPPAKTWF